MLKKNKKKPKPKPDSWHGQVWWFLWHDDSTLSWLVNIVFAILLIKFVLYPGLGILMGTEYPIVAVVSGSMEHHGSFDEWWSQHKSFYLERGITKEMFQDYPLSDGFSRGDLMVLTGTSKQEMERGDVVVFLSGKPYPIIHRVIALDEDHFETKGDNNAIQFTLITDPDRVLDETHVSYDQVVGKAAFKIPIVGYVKIAASGVLGFFGINIG